MMSEATVSAGHANALMEFAAAHGAERARLESLSGITPEALLDRDNLMRAAKEITGDPALPLEFGAASDFRKWTVVGLISHASATMREALEQLNRYGRLVTEVDVLANGPRFVSVERDGGLWLEDRRANPNAFPELTESTWSRFICESRANFPQLTFALAAHVTHAAPAHRAAYERLWQIPVTFGSDRNAIRMNPDWPKLQIQPDNRFAFGILTEHGETLLRELETSKTVRGRVESLLMPILHTGDIGVEAIAAKIGVSRQTLYRNLKAEGVTFELVLDSLRHTMALHYLRGQKVSVNETAYLVGFSDPAAFSRAFKRWTGMSPSAAKAK
jgi:AraC-like DNA-binding protein